MFRPRTKNESYRFIVFKPGKYQYSKQIMPPLHLFLPFRIKKKKRKNSLVETNRYFNVLIRWNKRAQKRLNTRKGREKRIFNERILSRLSLFLFLSLSSARTGNRRPEKEKEGRERKCLANRHRRRLDPHC